jgi:hypothetical protein
MIHGCCDTRTYGISVSGIGSRAFTFDGNIPVIVNEQDPIEKEELVIELQIVEAQSTAFSEPLHTNKNVLQAAVVPCADDEFFYLNKIDSIRVDMISAGNTTDITHQFIVLGTNEPISSYIPANSPGESNYLMQLSDTSGIPNQISYTLKVTLDDGSELSTMGGTIAFK